METWKDVKGFEGLYKISSYGRICSLERMKLDNGGYAPVRRRILKPQLNKDGYLMVRLFNNSKQLDISVHRLVALNFIPNHHRWTCSALSSRKWRSRRTCRRMTAVTTTCPSATTDKHKMNCIYYHFNRPCRETRRFPKVEWRN